VVLTQIQVAALQSLCSHYFSPPSSSSASLFSDSLFDVFPSLLRAKRRLQRADVIPTPPSPSPSPLPSIALPSSPLISISHFTEVSPPGYSSLHPLDALLFSFALHSSAREVVLLLRIDLDEANRTSVTLNRTSLIVQYVFVSFEILILCIQRERTSRLVFHSDSLFL
jgi:hypothetical protein